MHLASCDVYSNHTLVPELLRQNTQFGWLGDRMEPRWPDCTQLAKSLEPVSISIVLRKYHRLGRPCRLCCNAAQDLVNHHPKLGLALVHVLQWASTALSVGSFNAVLVSYSGARPSAGLRTRPGNRAEVMRCGDKPTFQFNIVELFENCLDCICCFRGICNLSILPLREELKGRVPPGIQHCYDMLRQLLRP